MHCRTEPLTLPGPAPGPEGTFHAGRPTPQPLTFGWPKTLTSTWPLTCGKVKDKLSLWERTYRSQSCGLVLDRDLNAAIYLAGWAHAHVTVSAAETLTACGADRKTWPRPAGGCEAGTGIAPEPTCSIGGPQTRGAVVRV